jgi:hypothetical protein
VVTGDVTTSAPEEEARSVGVRLERYPEHGVTLEIFTGAITWKVLHEHLSLLREGDQARLLYFDPTVDTSRLDVAGFPEFRRATAARLKELNVEKALLAFVCAPGGSNEQLLDFWCRYVQVDSLHPATPALFPSFQVACHWLSLPEAACRTLIEAVETRAPL